MAGIRYEVQGLDEALAALARIVENRPKMLKMIGAAVESQTRERIGSERTAPDGTAWPAWAAVTAARRHSGQSLLQASGTLIDSLHYVVDGDEVTVGSGMVYAAIHQFGGEAGRGRKVKIPARPYLGISAQNEADLMETIEDYIHRQITGA